MKAQDETAQLANAILAFRRYRSTVLPKVLFGEPAWELLLELFVADANGISITGRVAARHSGTPETVMSRWLQHLSVEKLLVGDGTGNLDDELTLSGPGMAAIETVLSEAQSLKDLFILT